MEHTISPDKVLGMLVGHGVGDALGLAHEFDKKQELHYTGHLVHPIYRYNRYKKTTTTYPVGSVSDDTGMTLALVGSILSTQGTYNKESVILNYMKWAKGDLDNTTNTGMGKNTRLLFNHPYKKYGTERYHQAYNTAFTSTPEHGWTQSNGSLMRCSPLALYNDDILGVGGLMELFKLDCSLSNPHPVNLECSMIYGLALWMALRGYDRHTTYTTVKDRTTHPQMKDIFNIIDTNQQYQLSGKGVKGHVLRAFYCAMWATNNNCNYKQTVDTFAGLPDTDTDTNAAIAGALAGAFEGFDHMMTDPTTLSNYNIVTTTNNINYRDITDRLCAIFKY